MLLKRHGAPAIAALGSKEPGLQMAFAYLHVRIHPYCACSANRFACTLGAPHLPFPCRCRAAPLPCPWPANPCFPTMAKFGQVWPHFGEIGSMFAKVGQAWHNLASLCQMLAEAGLHSTDFEPNWPSLARLCPMLDQCWPDVGQICRAPGQIRGQMWSISFELGQCRTEPGKHRATHGQPKLANMRPNSAEVGQTRRGRKACERHKNGA